MRATRGLILARDEDDGGHWPLRPLRRELAPVANTALIAHELRALHDAGIGEVGIVSDDALASAAEDAIGEAGLEVELVHIPPPAEPGLARRLLAAEQFAGDRPFVAELAGSLTQHDLARSAEVLVRKQLGALVVLAKCSARTPQVIPLGRPEAAAGPPGEGVGEESLAGANTFIFGGEIFDAARAAIDAQPLERVGLTDAVELLADKPGQVQAVLPTGWSRRIEEVEDLLELNRLVLQDIRSAEVPWRVPGSRIMGPVVVDETALIETSVLNGPLAIAANTHISDSYVGPYTAIGAGARIDGTEIERSVVLSSASISPVGVRIEGSVIGANAQVTRDLAAPRALQLWLGEDARVSLV
jgi:glucose-1-phosphate thymidylyltransferase